MKIRIADRQFRLPLILAFLFLIWFYCGVEADADSVSLEDTPSEILVRFRHDADISGKKEQNLGIPNLEFIHSFKRFNIHVLRVQTSMDSGSLTALVETLRKDPDVEWAEPNFKRHALRTPDDPMFPSQWHLVNTGQSGGTVGADIHADEAWNMITGSFQVVVAVLDTGIDYNHPDLKPNIWHNSGEDWTTGGMPGHNGIDDDGNGYVDDYYGINVVENPQEPPLYRWPRDPMDTEGHGTHVAGIIGAVGNNAVGVSGINWNVKMMALRFLGPDGGDIEGVVECVDYILSEKARGVPIRVVNASYGGSYYSRFEEEAYKALERAGILLVAAAGNSAEDLSESSNYPASYNLDNMINVAATTRHDELAYFSNYNSVMVHLGAPGSRILSTYLDGRYETMGGTSMATPQVTGAVALLYSFLSPTFSECKERILRGVDIMESMRNKVLTNGRLNIYNSMRVALRGPYIFSLSPLMAKPGDDIVLKGVRFGTDPDSGSVMFSGVEAEITSWADTEIRCKVPNLGESETKIVVSVNGISSNSVPFDADLYHRYYLPLSSMEIPRVTYLILTNLHDEAVNASVMVSEPGDYGFNKFEESLQANQSVYRRLDLYGLHSANTLVWVESSKDIMVSAIVSSWVGDGPNFVAVKALEH